MKKVVFVSFLLLAACAKESPVYNPTCGNQPALTQDCMAKERCGTYESDSGNYLSCKLRCEERIHKQCRMVRKPA